MTHRIPKKLFFSVLLVLLWLSFVVEGSHALFTDTATLTSNSLTTGTTDLLISDSQSASSAVYAESRPGFTHNLSPGESDEKYILLKNDSPSDISLDIDVAAAQQSGDIDTFKATTLEFTPVDEAGTPMGSSVFFSLSSSPNSHISLGTSIAADKYQRFSLKTSLNQGFTEQAMSTSYDLVFTGTQHESS